MHTSPSLPLGHVQPLSPSPFAAGLHAASLTLTPCRWSCALPRCPRSPSPSTARVARCPPHSSPPHRSRCLAPAPYSPFLKPLASPARVVPHLGWASIALLLVCIAWAEGGGNMVCQLGKDGVEEVGDPSVPPASVRLEERCVGREMDADRRVGKCEPLRNQ